MNASQFAPGMRALAILVATLTTLGAKAQGVSTQPAGSQPGWLVTVGRAGDDLGRTTASPLATFAAPASGFDLGSYRGAVEKAAAYGLAYDAKGLLNVQSGGPYKIRVTASWDGAEAGSTEAHCAVKLRVEAADLIDWNGAVTAERGRQELDGSVDLQPGPHDAALHVACDQPLGSRFRVDVALKAPGDADPRPPGPFDIVHAGTGATAMRAPPPSSAPPPSPPPAGPAPGAPDQANRQTLVATTDLRIRDEPRETARTVGRLLAGQSVDVLGPAPDPAWYRLAQGGYASAGFLKQAGAAGPPRPASSGQHVAAPTGKYQVGDCATYRMPANLGGGRHEMVEGTACLQADGRWRIVK